jgi:hypothetical protein
MGAQYARGNRILCRPTQLACFRAHIQASCATGMMRLMTGKSPVQVLEQIEALEERVAAARTECEIWASSEVEKKAYREAEAGLRALEQGLERLQREAFVFMATQFGVRVVIKRSA